jgi:hypothetical protein
MATPRRTALGTGAAVLAVCALALALRWQGLAHALPHSTFRDGYYVYTQVKLMRAHDPEPEREPNWGIYPHVVARLVTALPDPDAAPVADGTGLATNLEHAAATFMQVREISVLLSVLAVAATFGVARAFLPRGWSLFAAVLVAASLLHIFFSQQEKCHGPGAGTAALAVLAAMHLRRAPTFASFVLGGIAAGIAVGTLQSGAAVLLPCLAAVVLVWRADRAARKRILAGSLIALALVALAFRVFYPWYFSAHPIAQEAPSSEGDGMLDFSGHHIELKQLKGGGFLVILDTLISFEPFALVLGLVGVAALGLRLRKTAEKRAPIERGDLWVVLAYVVPYTLAVGIYGLSYERFVMPLVPFLAILAAIGARAFVELVSRSPAVRAVLASALLAAPVLSAWKLGAVRAAPDTFQRAAAWIAQNAAPERDRIDALPYLDLPIFYTEDALHENVRGDLFWLTWQARLSPAQRAGPRYDLHMPKGEKETKQAVGNDPLAYFQRLGSKYALIQDVADDFRVKALPRTIAALRNGAKLEERISPLTHDTGESAKLAIRYTKSAFERPFFVHLWHLRCEGPTIEIYRL